MYHRFLFFIYLAICSELKFCYCGKFGMRLQNSKELKIVRFHIAEVTIKLYRNILHPTSFYMSAIKMTARQILLFTNSSSRRVNKACRVAAFMKLFISQLRHQTVILGRLGSTGYISPRHSDDKNMGFIAMFDRQKNLIIRSVLNMRLSKVLSRVLQQYILLVIEDKVFEKLSRWQHDQRQMFS